MPEQPQHNNILRLGVGLLLLTLVAFGIFYLMKNDPAPVTPNPASEVPDETEEVTEETPRDPSNDPPPAELEASVEAEIRKITAQVDAGTMTREEAQRRVNEILGIE